MATYSPSSQISPQDERVLAAISHAAILLPMWGLIAPVVIWITQREKSRFVAFHALQAGILHFVMILTWFLAGACYIGSFFLAIAGAITLTGTQGPETASGGLFFLLPFLMFFLIILASLAGIVLGVAAAIQTFRGKDFRYPLIANWAERYQQNEAGGSLG